VGQGPNGAMAPRSAMAPHGPISSSCLFGPLQSFQRLSWGQTGTMAPHGPTWPHMALGPGHLQALE
jgi:hypothetical protein